MSPCPPPLPELLQKDFLALPLRFPTRKLTYNAFASADRSDRPKSFLE